MVSDSSDTLTLEILDGGLVDHLFLSHIPRIAKETGKFKRVFISQRSNFRNPQIRELIWEKNPFVDGFTDNPGRIALPGETSPDFNILDAVMISLGLDDGVRLHEPEIYYRPPDRRELNQMVVFDPNYISFVGFISVEKICGFLKSRRLWPDRQMIRRGRSFSVNGEIPDLEAKDLRDYCSIITSCREFICLSSGSATLAAALGKGSTVFWGRRQKRVFLHSALHEYVFVPYSWMDMFLYYFRRYVLGQDLNLRRKDGEA